MPGASMQGSRNLEGEGWESAWQKGNGRECGSCGVEARKEEEVDAAASSTTTDTACTGNPFSFFGLRAAWAICLTQPARPAV